MTGGSFTERNARTNALKRVGISLLLAGIALIVAALTWWFNASLEYSSDDSVGAANPQAPDDGDSSSNLDGQPAPDSGNQPYEPQQVNSLDTAALQLDALGQELTQNPENAMYWAPSALEEVSDFLGLVMAYSPEAMSEEAVQILSEAQAQVSEAYQSAMADDLAGVTADVSGAAASVSAALTAQEVAESEAAAEAEAAAESDDVTSSPEESEKDAGPGSSDLSVGDYVSMAGAAGGLLAAAGTVITATASLTTARRKSREASGARSAHPQESKPGPASGSQPSSTGPSGDDLPDATTTPAKSAEIDLASDQAGAPPDGKG